MPLVPAQLIQGLLAVFKSQPSDTMVAAQQIAMAYDAYCKTAVAPPGLPILTGFEAQVMAQVLAGGLSAGAAPAVASAFGNGINSYWLTPPVIFVGGPAAGVATAVGGLGVLISGLTSVFANTNNTNESAATQIGTLMDAATKTVVVTYATPPPPAGPPPPALVL